MKTKILMLLISVLFTACVARLPVIPPTAAPPTVASSAGFPLPAPTATPAPEWRVTVLYDNIAHDPRLKTPWGFAALIQVDGTNILFDTGSDAPTLLANMRTLGIDPATIQGIVFSHPHSDHTGGLQDLLQTGIRPKIYVSPSFPDPFKQQVKKLTSLVEVSPGQAITLRLYTTGEMRVAGFVEQALVIKTPAGLVIITGCAHPGIVPIVKRAKELFGGPVTLIMGGLHLLDKSAPELGTIVTELRQLGVEQIAPSHCSGDQAIALFAAEYGKKFVRSGAGYAVTSLSTQSPVGTSIAPTTIPQAAPSQVAVDPSAQATQWRDMDFDTFLDQSYRALVARFPERITELGMADQFGVRNDRLNDLSDAYIRETQKLEIATRAQLQLYDRAQLAPAQQFSYDVYAWYLDDQIRGHAFMYNDYPLNPTILSYHTNLTQFFTDIHPIRNLADAQDYVVRLTQVKRQVDQVRDGMKRRQEAGVILPKLYFPVVLRELRAIAQSNARATPFYATFQTKVNALKDASDAEKATLLQNAEKEIDASVIPAFRALVEFMEQQEKIATNDIGASRFSNGAEYYAYVLRRQTTTDLTAEQIHGIGLREVAHIQSEIRAVAKQLGYPADATIAGIIERATRDGGVLQGEQIVKRYEAIIQEAENYIAPVFDLKPKAKVIVIGAPVGGYYNPGALDGSRPGAFYATAQGMQYQFKIPTIAYHEAIPGHHTQIAIAQELKLPFLRNEVGFNGYIEGWALYAERLMWELGAYKDNPSGDIGRLQYELLRAARLVADTGINAKKWSYDQSLNYMLTEVGLPRGIAESEVARYVCLAGQATSYKVGMTKILELRQKAKDKLGNRFDLKEFNNVVLSNGSVPLTILERVVDEYIARKAR